MFLALCLTSTMYANANTDSYKDLYKEAIEEYRCANYGSSKELFEFVVEQTDAFPKAYFYLGCIYGNDYLPFHNPQKSVKQFRYCIANRKSDNRLKQICYTKILLNGKLNKEQVNKLMEEDGKISDKTYYYINALSISQWVNDTRKMFSDDQDKYWEESRKVRTKTDIDIGEPAYKLVGE